MKVLVFSIRCVFIHRGYLAVCWLVVELIALKAVADRWGGGCQLLEVCGGANLLFCKICAKRLHENERMWARRGPRIRGAPLDLPLLKGPLVS